MSIFSISAVLVGLLALASPARCQNSSAPVVSLRNGSYQGLYSEQYDQDFFLGVPYAQPPLGSLRWVNPQSLNTTWKGTRNATAYSDSCYGYASSNIWFPNSEDCLTINVVRPAGTNESSSLPVGFWIHGGGLTAGSSRDQRYNLSFIVQNAVEIGKPFIGVSINYRLGPYGFFYNQDVLASGQVNAGFRDQRLALHWVQENIGAFGGDPTKVTVWGESSGASSVAWHTAAYGGRDDGLFRAAIQESGSLLLGGITPSVVNTAGQAYSNLLNDTGCNLAIERLDCLRGLSAAEFNSYMNGTNSSLYSGSYGMVIDGDIVRNTGSKSLNDGTFVKVPFIVGANTDEGTGFGPTGINTTEEFYEYLTVTEGIPAVAASKILDLYPVNSTEQIAAYLGNASTPAEGLMWRRTSTFASDYYMDALRRHTCQALAAHGATPYCYRFNVRNTDVPWISGAAHFEEVSFVFHNLDGVGYQSGAPFNGTPASYADLSTMMASVWASFIVDADPNTSGQNVNQWPVYEADNSLNFVFNANITSDTEPDTYRKDAIQYIIDIEPAFPR